MAFWLRFGYARGAAMLVLCRQLPIWILKGSEAACVLFESGKTWFRAICTFSIIPKTAMASGSLLYVLGWLYIADSLAAWHSPDTGSTLQKVR